MWVPIFEQNAAHLVRALDEYIAHLEAFRGALAAGDTETLYAITLRANDIRRVLDALGARATAGASPAPVTPSGPNEIERSPTLGGTP
jgi:hypothetical protein